MKTGRKIMKHKKIVAIQDISCIGRCSLTVALPIISSAGIETSIIPTAILSTHTSGFENYTFRDLTDDILEIVNHWKTLDVSFDAIYTGYLASHRQAGIIAQVFDTLCSKDTLIIVDPAMADNGVLYPAFEPDFPKAMANLVSRSHVAVPNITEACLMLDIPYQEKDYDEAYIRKLLLGITKLGASQVVITGVSYRKDQIGAATYDKVSNTFDYVHSPKENGYYHGTGDIFSSGLVSGLLSGLPLSAAAQLAINLTYNSIMLTGESPYDFKYGVNFEAAIPAFIKELGL